AQRRRNVVDHRHPSPLGASYPARSKPDNGKALPAAMKRTSQTGRIKTRRGPMDRPPPPSVPGSLSDSPSPPNAAVKAQAEHGPEDGHRPPRTGVGREWLVWQAPDHPGDTTADQGADDSQHNGHYDSHRLPPRHQQPGHGADNQPSHDPSNYAH